MDAGTLVARAAKEIQGGGGKGKEFAMAGGKSPEGLDLALEAARETLAAAR
ncbi:MAG: DHHA1 domain-containing protein [Acidimicrobiales bacterium]